MLNVPQSIRDATVAQEGNSPAMWLDVWLEKGPEYKITTYSQWVGTNDPMKGSDLNVSYTRVRGAVTLANGNAVTAPAYAGPDYYVGRMNWSIQRQVLCHYKGGFAKKQILDGVKYLNERAPKPVVIRWRATASQYIDTLRLRARYAGVATMTCHVAMFDYRNKQMGRTVNFTPGAGLSTITLSGFRANVERNKDYYIKIWATPVNRGLLPAPYCPAHTDNFSASVLIYSFNVGATPWRIKAGAGYFAIGGNEGYQPSGSITRQFDVGSVPTNDGAFTFVASTSGPTSQGTTLIATAWYTDDPARINDPDTTQWQLFGRIRSGDIVPPHRWWRVQFYMESNRGTGIAGGHDYAPVVHDATFRYRPDPVVFGTHPTQELVVNEGAYSIPWSFPLATSTIAKRTKTTSGVELIGASQVAASLTPQIQSGMIGQITFDLAPEPEVDTLMTYPVRGTEVRLRVGFDGVPDTMTVYRGICDDIQYRAMHYKLHVKDDMNLADRDIPNTTDTANKWNPVVYTSMHLADIAFDMLSNQLLIPEERIDRQSLADIKAAMPGRIGSRTISKPTSAFKMLAELAWLLESQWVISGVQLSLQREPSPSGVASWAANTAYVVGQWVDNGGNLYICMQAGTSGTTGPTGTGTGIVDGGCLWDYRPPPVPVDAITGGDIKEGLSYRRGWKDLKNEALILTGYSGQGEGSEQFASGVAFSSADSVASYDITTVYAFKDFWNLPQSTELVALAASFVERWKDGRRIVQFNGALRLIGLEPGDVVTFESDQVPPGDPGPYTMMVVGKHMDWMKQEIRFTLMEV